MDPKLQFLCNLCYASFASAIFDIAIGAGLPRAYPGAGTPADGAAIRTCADAPSPTEPAVREAADPKSTVPRDWHRCGDGQGRVGDVLRGGGGHDVDDGGGGPGMGRLGRVCAQAAATDDKPKEPLGDVESDVVFFDASKRESHHKGSKYKKLFKRLRSSTHKCQV